MMDSDRLWRLMNEHPDTTPSDLEGALPYLICGPSSVFSPTARFERFRNLTLLPMIAARPKDPNPPKFLRCVEAVIAWRAARPPEDRFWRADPD